MRRLRMPAMPKQGWHQLVSNHPEFADAVAFFRDRLGDECIREGRPFATTFATTIQGDVPEGVRILRLVKALETTQELDELVRSLGGKHERDVRGAELTLRIAAAQVGRGGDVRLIPRGGGKTADLSVALCERSVTVECTCINENDENENAGEFLQYLVNWVEREPGRLDGQFLARNGPSRSHKTPHRDHPFRRIAIAQNAHRDHLGDHLSG